MIGQIRTKPATVLAFLAACSLCLLPLLAGGVAAGALLSALGGVLNGGWLIMAGIALVGGSAAFAVRLVARNRNAC